jgi:hypothetical protein
VPKPNRFVSRSLNALHGAADQSRPAPASRWACGVTEVDGESPVMDRAGDTESDIPPRQLVQDSDVDIAPSAGVAAAFSRWWLGRLGAISDDLVKRPAGEFRQLSLHSLDVFPQRVGR